MQRLLFATASLFGLKGFIVLNINYKLCESKNNVLTDLEKVTSSFEKVLHFLAASVLDK